MTIINLNVAPTEIVLNEVVAGSELRFSFKVEYESPAGSGTYVAFDFTGYTLTGVVKYNVNDVAAAATLSITAPGVSGAGWVDVVLTGAQTTALWVSGGCRLVFSVKMTPNSDANAGVTLVHGSFPIVKRATP